MIKKILKKMGYIDCFDRVDVSEILIDIAIVSLVVILYQICVTLCT